MVLLLIGFLLVLMAFALMLKDYGHNTTSQQNQSNRIWLYFLVISVFIGIAPFVALAYLATRHLSKNETSQQRFSSVTYNADGTYTVYKTDEVKAAPSPGKLAFRIVGGVIAGLVMAFGLLIVGVLLLVTLAPSVACGGSSKCY